MPTVYSTRWSPLTHGPWTAGWMKSRESTVAVALGQLRSKRPLSRAVWTAVSCFASSCCCCVAQPGARIARAASVVSSTRRSITSLLLETTRWGVSSLHCPGCEDKHPAARPLAGRLTRAAPRTSSRGQRVRKPDRLWQPVARREPQDPGDRRGEAHPMADGHVHRPHAGARAQDSADRLAAVAQGHPCAAGGRERRVRAHQTRLRDADGGDVEQHAEVAGQAEAPRMGEAVGVAEDQIRELPQ